MAPKLETGLVGHTFQHSIARIGVAKNKFNKFMLGLPGIGPILQDLPGRRSSLMLSTILPTAMGYAEWRMYEAIRLTGIDPVALGLVTVGVLAATKLVERETILKRNWSSNIWTLGWVDVFRVFEHKEKNETWKKIWAEPLTAQSVAKLTAILTYPATIKAMIDAGQSRSTDDLFYITFVQNFADIILALLNEVELKRPGTFVKEHKEPKEYIKW